MALRETGPGIQQRLRVIGRFLQIRGLSFTLLFAACVISAGALDEPTALTGTVRDSRAAPLKSVQWSKLLRPDTTVGPPVLFTDEYGPFFCWRTWYPETYSLKATGNAFSCPLFVRISKVLRPPQGLQSNLTLSTVIEAFQWLPAKRRFRR